MAFINGKVLKLGDKINGYELVTIEKNSVTLKKAKKKVVLKLEGLN
jgi:peroxiredoxin